uniref:Replication protein A2 n=1 Tax=Amphilophus citrinellus TaxID=61819 RepID=A0A3Q0SGH2_AMPCI
MWNQGGYSESSMAGGYTQSPGGFASPALSQGGEKKGRTRANQIIPCTVSQLMSASQADESFRVGDVEIAQVTIVGVIRSTDKSMTNIQYKVDDMTAAPMDVKQWVDTEDPSVDSTVLPPGTYVKVSGNLRSFQVSLQSATDKYWARAFCLVPGCCCGIPQSQLAAFHNQTPPPTPVTAVLCLIRSCPDQQGISIHELKKRLGSMSMMVIKQAVEFLSNEGHIFSTIDEDHYKSTDSDD